MNDLISRQLAVQLPRRPGQKEARYVHLLSGEPAPEVVAPETSTPTSPTRVQQLETELRELRAEVDELKRKFEQFKALMR